jgi:heme A synthase
LGDTLFPAKSLAEGLQQDMQPGAHFLLRLRVYHPFIAITVAVYTLYLIVNLYRQQDRQSQRFMQLLVGVGVLQLSAGLTNLLLLAPIPLQIIHLFLADTVWITYVITAASLLSINNSSYTVEIS